MFSRAWTILLCSHNGRRRGQVHLTFPGLCILLLLAAAMLYFPGRAVVAALYKARNIHALARLEEQNRQLRAEVVKIDWEIALLAERFDSMQDENQIYRQIAGLDELEQEVLEVGIGGVTLDFDDDLMEFDSRLARRISRQDLTVDELLRRAGLARQSIQDSYTRVSEVSRRWSHLPSITPTSGYISSTFGRRIHPLFRQMHYHTGLDFSTSSGEPIFAPADGKVVHSAKSQGLGLTIVLDHDFGIKTIYGHCSRLTVKSGQEVHRGDVIGFVGRSGITTGPHLHYEVHVNGRPKNPFPYLLDLFPERL
ncbi:MAG: M23 family metallopeptidase [Candidatus Glassbacteria bacterium]|nr:M23 family metallopeptidase [Candidatus Glassbacteria bacterium]